jgi:hypothetical protein
MADPLTALVDREAPAQTNFFSPPSGQGTLARYGNSRVGLAESEGLAKATGDLTRDRIDRAREQRFNRQADFDEKQFEQKLKMDEAQLKREELLADADEVEATDRRTARESRAGFLLSLGKLDGDDPDIDTKLNELLSGLPPGLLETDEVAKSMLQVIGKSADDARTARNAEASKKQTLENQLTMLRDRRKYDVGLKGLTDEDLQSAITPDGELDPFVLGNLAGRRQAEREMGEFKEKEDVRMDTWQQKAGESNEEFRARTKILQENREKTVKARDEEWRAREQEKNKEYDRRQGEDAKTWAARTEILHKNRKELAEEQRKRKALLNSRDLSISAADRQRAVNQALQDSAAFPKHLPALEAFAKANYTMTPALLKVNHPDLLAAAEDWDKNQMFKELDAAYDMPSAQAYVDVVPNLNEKQKAKRLLVWEHAFKDYPFETEDTAPPAPEGVVENFDPTAETAPEAPAAAPATPAAAPAPLPKDKWEVGKLHTMSDGSKRVYKGDGKWE